MQRAISWLMFAVLLLGSIAPAFAAVPPQPIACHRPQLSEHYEAASAAQPPCHGMSGHAGHNGMAGAVPTSQDSVGKANCCDGHDCCRRQDRSQGVTLAAAVSLQCVYAVVAQVQPSSVQTYSAVPANDHSGRAPPSL